MQQMYPIVFLINISGRLEKASGLKPQVSSLSSPALPFQGGDHF